MVSASACVGLTLPGMIELPGSFSGMRSSPRPERGPEASRRTSLAIFDQRGGERLRARRARAPAPRVPPSAANLFGAGRTAGRSRRRPALQRPWPRTPGACSGRCRPRCRRARAHTGRQRGVDVPRAMLELRHVAGELLAQRERRRILQVGAADLDDCAERVRSSPPAYRAAPPRRASSLPSRRVPPRRASRSERRRWTTGRG